MILYIYICRFYEYEMHNWYVAVELAMLRLGLGGCIEKAHEMLRDLGVVPDPHETHMNMLGNKWGTYEEYMELSLLLFQVFFVN